MEKNERGSVTKKTFKFLFSFLLFGIFVIAILPSLASTPWGNRQIVSVVNRFIPGQIEIKDAHWSWFKGQTINGLLLKDPEGINVLSIDNFSTDASLISIALARFSQNSAQINGLNANLIEEQPGVTNIQRALGSHLEAKKALQKNSYKPFAITLTNVNATLLIPSHTAPLTLHLLGHTKQGEQAGRFDVHVALTGIDFTRNHFKITDHTDITLNASVTQFPVALIDHIISIDNPRLAGIAQAALGKTIDLNINKTISNTGAKFTLLANASTLSAQISGILDDKKLTLAPDGKAVLTFSPELIGFLSQLQQSSPFQLARPTRAELNITELIIPFDNPFKGISAVLDLKIPQIVLNGSLVQYAGQQASLDIHTKLAGKYIELEATVMSDLLTIDSLHAQKKNHEWVITSRIKAKPATPLASIFGETIRLQISAEKGLFEGTITSDLANIRAAGKLNNDYQFLMTEPAKVQFSITPIAAKILGFNKANEILQLNKQAVINLTINPIKKKLNLQNIGISSFLNLSLSGEFQVDELSFTSPAGQNAKDSIFIRNISAPWEINFLENRLKMALNGDTLFAGNTSGFIHGNLILNKWLDKDTVDLSNAKIDATFAIQHIPVILLSALLGESDLNILLGKTLDLDLNFKSDVGDPNLNIFDVTFNSEGLEGSIALNFGNILTLANHHAVMNFNLTPERFDAMRNILRKQQGTVEKSEAIALLEPTKVTAKIQRLNMPLSPHKFSSWIHLGIKAEVSIASLKVSDPHKSQNLNLENINGFIDSENISEDIAFKMSAREKSRSGKDGDWNFSGSIQHALIPDGQINLQDLSIQLAAKSNRLPAGLFCQMACPDSALRDKIEALLGHSIDTDIQLKLQRMNGPIQAKLKGENGSLILDAMINDGTLTLNRPFEVEVAATPQLGKSILQDVIPILSGVVKTEKPIRITIDPKEFYVSIKDFTPENIQIGQATIDLGKIEFTNDGELASVLSLLNPPAHKNLSVWFTPLYVKMKKGSLKLQRMDMLLLNQYPIAIWGKVNFLKDNVNLTIGLTGTALNNALNLSSLDDNYMLQIPFMGRIGEASIDKAKATTRISALVAQNQGSPQGYIIGTVLGIAGGSLTEEEPPKPTTNPLPWESIMIKDKKIASQEASPKKHKSNNPIKVIEKGAIQLLDNIFK